MRCERFSRLYDCDDTPGNRMNTPQSTKSLFQAPGEFLEVYLSDSFGGSVEVPSSHILVG